MLQPASVAFAALGLIWGSNFIFMKWAAESISAGQITFLRVLFGFAPILLFAAIRRVLDWRHLQHAHHFLVMSVLATSLYYFAFAAGTSLLDSGVAGALSAANRTPLGRVRHGRPARRAVHAARVGEPLSILDAVGVLLILTGVVILR